MFSTSAMSEQSDAQDLKNDIALQKLLRESHLLRQEGSSFAPSGKSRHKATDLHLQKLGSKHSILGQERMPMSHRKGITAKATEREMTRRKEAREAGIILETGVKIKQKRVQRDRGVGKPTVGRFKGGTLHLTSRDVASIETRKLSGSRKTRRR